MLRIAVISALLLSGCSALAVTLSEIMFDPGGSESADEFIELYNNSEFAVNLSGWYITDGADTDRVLATEQGTLATPHQYVLILDPDYLSGESSSYDGMIPETALILTIDNSTFGSRGLSNSSGERVTLLNAQRGAVSACTYSVGNVAGHSDEKRIPDGTDSTANWVDSEVLNGTPGAPNSVTPPARDLAVIRFVSDPAVVEANQEFRLRATVLNVGLTALSGALRISEPSLSDTAGMVTFPIPELGVGDSLAVTTDWLTLGDTPRRFIAHLAGDDRSDNDSLRLTIGGTGGTQLLLINEIMYSPASGRSEWVEFVNRSGAEVNVNGWRFADGSALNDTAEQVTLPALTIAPDSLLVLASDSTIFFESVPPTATVFVWSAPSPSLNNSGDSLAVFDPGNQLVDRVDYRGSWGGAAGISVERISPEAESNDEANWAASLDASGGTPGRVNTRSLGAEAAAQQIMELMPNPFSPDGDGRDEVLQVRYRLRHADSRLDLTIFDSRGRRIRELANNAPAGTTGTVLWDGSGDDGQRVPTGVYIVYLEALGQGQSRIETAKRAVVLVRKS